MVRLQRRRQQAGATTTLRHLPCTVKEASEDRFRLVADNTSDGIVIFGANRRIQYESPAYVKQLGYSEEVELGRSPDQIYALMHQEDRDAVFSGIERAIAFKASDLLYSYRIRHRLGHTIWRGGLRQLFALAADLQVVAEAASSAEVLACLRQQPVDLLLLDLNMPGISGADLIAHVKAQQSDLPILIFSMHNEPLVAARMLKAGASGYITKTCEPDILLSAVRMVAAHGNYIDPAIAERMVFDASSTSQHPLHALLSERELEVLRLLTTGLGVNAIATQLTISRRTVSTHKARLLEKLNLSSMAELMRYAMQHHLLG